MSNSVVKDLRRDARVKCTKCRRWMRNSPTDKTPGARRASPHADRCTECPPSHRCFHACYQCRGLK